MKAYVCVFVLMVRAVHLELISDLTSDAFIACLRRFISCRGIPWSDHGTMEQPGISINAIIRFVTTKNVNW